MVGDYMEIIDKVKLVVNTLDEKKADDIKVIDISEISSIGDYFIIATGDNQRLVHSLCNEVEEKLSKENVFPKNIEGFQHGNWVLMDYEDFIIHVFDKENRGFYNLDRIWKDGKEINISEL